MYEDLVKRLRSHYGWALNETLDAAADAIDNLNDIIESQADILAKHGGETQIKQYAELAVKYFNLLGKIPLRWTSVDERLPDKYGEYLVLWKPRKEGILPRNKLFYEIAEFEMDYNGIDGEWISEIPQSAPMGGYEVCYWMDLPPEPREEET